MEVIVQERALYSHFKSTEAEPKRYITLYKEQDADGYTYIHYVSEGDWDTIHIREETEFLESVNHNGISMGRFILVQAAIITVEEVNNIRQQHAEDS
jgi:hypothetical protein